MIHERIKRAVIQLILTLFTVSFAGALAGCASQTTTNDAEETTSAANPLPGGAIIRSDSNPSLAITAWLLEGAEVKLEKPCLEIDPPILCWYNDHWIYKDGMLVAAANPDFAILVTTAEFGAQLKVATGCTPQIGECAWTLVGGTFISNAGWAANLRVWGGYTAAGNTVTLHNGCQESYADCTWTMRDVMITDGSGATGFDNFQASSGDVQLRSTCSPGQIECLWTISHGVIYTAHSTPAAISGRPPLYTLPISIGYWYGANEGSPLKLALAMSCGSTCKWTFGSGWMRPDANWNYGVNLNGAGGSLSLTSAWQGPTNTVVVR